MSYLVDEKKKVKREIVFMADMKPLQVGRVVEVNNSNDEEYVGNIVWRTQSSNIFEVMDLSELRIDEDWGECSDAKVELLSKGEEITLVLCNE